MEDVKEDDNSSSSVIMSIENACKALAATKPTTSNDTTPKKRKKPVTSECPPRKQHTRSKKSHNKRKLSVEERTESAELYNSLSAQKGRKKLKLFLSQPENSPLARRKQLSSDAKRLRDGHELRAHGRPRFFGGKENEERMKTKIKQLALENEDRSTSVLMEVLKEGRECAAAKSDTQSPYKRPSRATVNRIKQQLFKRASNHSKTSARVVAEKSQRNFVSYAAMLAAVHTAATRKSGVHPALFLSQDFTRLVFGENNKNWQWLPADWEDIEQLPTGVKRVEKRVVAVAVQACIAATGGSAPFLIYVKAPNMKDGVQEKIKLKGVGSSCNPNEFAWLIIDNKRKVHFSHVSMC